MKTDYTLLRALTPKAMALLVLGLGFWSGTAYGQEAKRAQTAPEKAKADIRTADDRWQKGGLFEGLAPEREIKEKRSLNSKSFQNPDGSITTQIGRTLHYKDAAGAWQDINLHVAQGLSRPGYPFGNETNNIKSYFPAVPGERGVSMDLGNGTEFGWWKNPSLRVMNGGQTLRHFTPGAVTGTTSYETLRYNDIYPGITEEFVVLTQGLENNTIIRTLSPELGSLPSSASLEFSQTVALKNGWEVIAGGKTQSSDFSADGFSIRIPGMENEVYFGHIVVFDAGISKDEAMLVHMPAEKLDAAQKAKLAAHVYTVTYNVRFTNGGIEVLAQLPAAWLQASDRAFPVTVDPTVTISPSGLTGTYYGPMTHWYGYQRHADLYLQSEIGSYGTITEIAYNSTTGGTAGSRPTKVYMRTVAGTTLAGGSAWNSATYTGTGATLCLDASTDQGDTPGWKTLTLTTPFPYTQDNLLIMVGDFWGGSGATKYYNISNSVTARQAGKRVDTNDPGDGTNLDLENYLPETRITYTFGTPCSGTPTIGAASGPASACSGVNFTLNLAGIPSVDGLTYQWQSSTDGGNTWNNLGGAQPTAPYLASQTQATSYRVTVTCTASGLSVTSNTVAVGMNAPNTCYCTPVASNCGDDQMTNVTFAGINNNSTCAAGTGYSDYTGSIAPAVVMASLSYPISVTFPSHIGTDWAAVWIDFNQNGVFEPAEFTSIGSVPGAGGTITQSVAIPSGALAGTTRMRVRAQYSQAVTDTSACSAYYLGYGESEDYLVTISAATACAGTPAAAVATSTDTTVCVGDAFTLNATPIAQSGISYQWQSSTNGTTWNNLGGSQTAPAYAVASQSVTTYYRLVITCSNGGATSTSNVVTVHQNPGTACYCINNIPYNCTDGDLVLNVTFGSINNSSGCGNTTNGYSDYTGTVAPATINRGTSVPISVTVGDGWQYESVGVWIDYNQNGLLDSLEGEYTNVGTGFDQVVTANINIPATALPGTTRMRVVGAAVRTMLHAYVCGPTDPDANFGEMEDYLVTILAPGAIDSVVVTTQGNVPAVIGTPTGTLQLVATIYPASMPQGVTWSIRNVTGTATISSGGLVTASAFGTVWGKAVSVADPTKSDSILINIQPIVVDSVVVTTQGNVPAVIGSPTGTLQLNARVYPLTVSQAVTWSIRNVTGTATINTSGLVTASAAGTVWGKAVSVADPTKSDSILITITPTVTSVVVTTQGSVPAVISTPAGTLQLVATVNPTSLSQAVTWSIRNTTGAATISSAGLVTAQSNGFVWARARSVVNPLMADSILIAITQQNAGIDEAAAAFGLELFPNPSKDLVTLRSSAQHGRMDLQVTDLAGRTVFSRAIQAGELNTGVTVDVAILPAGVYVFRLRGDDLKIDRKVIRQ